MAERNRTGRGGRRRSGGDGGEDLFATQLSKVVEQAFAVTVPQAGSGEAPARPEAPIENQVVLPPVDAPDAHHEVVPPHDTASGASLDQPDREVATGNGVLFQ